MVAAVKKPVCGRECEIGAREEEPTSEFRKVGSEAGDRRRTGDVDEGEYECPETSKEEEADAVAVEGA